MVNDMDAELFARHPVAYVEATDGSGGFAGLALQPPRRAVDL